jgi:hypothetical protein
MWKMSDEKVRQIFAEEAGVVRIGLPSRRQGRRLVRSRYTMRIPESTMRRVHERLTRALVPLRHHSPDV